MGRKNKEKDHTKGSTTRPPQGQEKKSYLERQLDILNARFAEEHKQRDQIPVEYNPKAYQWYQGINWATLWEEWLSKDKDGRFVYTTVNALAKKKLKSSQERDWMFAAIGPAENMKVTLKKEKKEIERNGVRKKFLPYIGDWQKLRESIFIGETDKISLLYGNPRLSALREAIKNNLDVLSASKGIADIFVEWLAKWTRISDQIDKYFDYTIASKDFTPEEVRARFNLYMEMQSELLATSMKTTQQVLRCMGVSENDISLLTQVVVASMKAGTQAEQAGMIEEWQTQKKSTAMLLSGTDGSVVEGVEGDDAEIKKIKQSFDNNPTLSLFMASFMQKSKIFNMEHPGIKMEGVAEEQPVTNGKKSNGGRIH